MWLGPGKFAAGFMHLGPEALYRTLRLKKRIHLPEPIETAVILFDRAFFLIPFSKHLAWFYTAVFRK
jgi:hypothetical protein